MAEIFYHALPGDWRKEQKYEWLRKAGDVSGVEWQEIKPDKRHNWVQTGLREEFEKFLPLGDRGAAGNNSLVPPVFRHYSNGVKTQRDTWAINFDRDALAANMERTISAYNAQVEAWRRLKKKPVNVEDFIDFDATKISWSELLKKELERGHVVEFDAEHIRPVLYRPFTSAWLYFDKAMNERRYGFPEILPTTETENIVIWLKAGGDWPFFALASKQICDLLPQGGSQCFSFYTYKEDGTERRENIPDATQIAFWKAYGDDESITKWDIFHYVYAVLHHPGYRTRFAANLKRELPRVPFAPDFHAFADAGQRLAELHVHYETQPEFPLRRVENREVPLDWRVEKMKLSADKRTLVYNEFLTLEGIPPETFDYRLGNRSALEWVIDQYQVSTDARSGIVSDPNADDDPQAIVKLLGRVITVSLETQKIVAALPAELGV